MGLEAEDRPKEGPNTILSQFLSNGVAYARLDGATKSERDIVVSARPG